MPISTSEELGSLDSPEDGNPVNWIDFFNVPVTDSLDF